jgi:hypothetical protein
MDSLFQCFTLQIPEAKPSRQSSGGFDFQVI